MKKLLLGIILGLAALSAAVALALGAIHLSEQPYKYCIDALSIEERSGLAREEILDNYRAVMRYLSPFYEGEFSLPSLAFSESGAFHFYECKLIFRAVYLAGALSALLWFIAAFKLKRGKLPAGTLAVSGAATLLLPAALFLGIALDFDRAFVIFHELFFGNELWIFDYRSDPIINILPQDFFMTCAAVIGAVLLAAAAAQFAAFAALKKRERTI
ncbi:MAG: TIGR01906 family membrane protein [Oscillospiraceae bacterium]|nr:TIGR01906 family membrane protein [Oscillospiraceae bacterium]